MYHYLWITTLSLPPYPPVKVSTYVGEVGYCQEHTSAKGAKERVTPHKHGCHQNPNSFYDIFGNQTLIITCSGAYSKRYTAVFYTQYMCVLVLCKSNSGARMDSGAPARLQGHAMMRVTGLQPAKHVYIVT